MTGRAVAKRELALAAASARDVLTHDELIEGVLEPIRRGTACSGVSLYSYDDQGVVRCLGGSLVDGTPHYSAELFDVDPIQGALFRRKHLRHAVVPRLFPEVDWALFQRGTAYNEFYRPHGVEDLLGVNLSDEPYGSPGTSGVLLTRCEREPRFDTELVNHVDRLRPGLLSAARRIERVAKVRRREAALEAAVERLSQRPTVIVDRVGHVLFMSREAELLLKGAEARASFAELAARALFEPGEETSFLLDGRQGSLRVEAHALRSPGLQPIAIATIQPLRSETPVQRWRLTRTETQVLGLLAEGLSNREIAGQLFVSLDTVKTHVSRVLAKSGTRSRAQLLVLLRDKRLG
jgi:DNA-binding CsgD family transcriptional regulator